MPIKTRFGVGELLGRNLMSVTPQQRTELRQQQQQGAVICPSRQTCYQFDPNGIPNGGVNCSKNGGICSVRRYRAEFQSTRNNSLIPSTVESFGTFATICPYRFLAGGLIYSWIGSELLGTPQPQIVRELPFLESAGADADETEDDEAVGRLDYVLVRPDAPVLTWCAVEMQAVYLSNSSTTAELNSIASSPLAVPFPVTSPRPDYRSCGPKRLLPQLQVKVPTLSRWGIKTAVVVDREFFDSLGEMEQANHPSNSDIAWFILRYEEQNGGDLALLADEVRYTTLSESIEGLVGAAPIPKPNFEESIASRLQSNYPPQSG